MGDLSVYTYTFNIPANKSLVWEAGYRYDYKPEKMFTNLKTGLGISLSFLYQKGLDDNYNATVKNGSDIDGKIDKINKFMKGGYGFVIGVYFLFERIKK